jgi:hypothetical protein
MIAIMGFSQRCGFLPIRLLPDDAEDRKKSGSFGEVCHTGTMIFAICNV